MVICPWRGAAYRIPEFDLPADVGSRDEAAFAFRLATQRDPETIRSPEGEVHYFLGWCPGCNGALFLSGTTVPDEAGRRWCRSCAVEREEQATGQIAMGFLRE